MFKETKRKGFNFFRSYFDVYNELETDKDKVEFLDALFDRQFLGVKPKDLKGMAKFAYISQTNSIDTQVKGYEDRMIGLNKGVPNYDPWQGVEKTILTPPQQVQEEEKGEVQVQGEEKEKINNNFLSEIKISDVEDKLKDYFEIAKAFQELFIKNLTEKNSSCVNQKNAKFGNYVDPIRLMMTKDEITKEQLTSVFKYLDSPQGEFWKPNILSTSKLREKFQQLIMKANEKSKNGQVNTVGNTGVSAEYLQQLRNNLQS